MFKRLGWPVILFSIFALTFFGIKFMGNSKSLKEEPLKEINTVTISPTPTSAPTVMGIDTEKNYQALVKTSEGDMTIDLYASKTPITVNNFVTLAKKGFYDNTVFHRTIKDFMIQGGDPKGDGTGGPGYKFDDEPFDGEYTKGTIAMANSGPNTNGSQFFIVHKDASLPKNYVIFGKVISGIETVDKIAEAPVKPNPLTGELSVPVEPAKVLNIDIFEK